MIKGTNPITIAVIVLVAGVFLWYVVGNSGTSPAVDRGGRPQIRNRKQPGDRGAMGSSRSFSFARAQNRAKKKIYAGHLVSLFCGCPIGPSRVIDNSTCGYKPRDKTRDTARAVWKHVVPMKMAAKHLDCWRGDDPSCVDAKGKTLKKRKCCTLAGVSPQYERMESDLQNIAPTIDELNKDRKDFTPGIVEGEKREYGACDFEIDASQKTFEPAESIRGDIARIYLYMADTYGMKLKAKERDILLQWHKKDPPDKWEKERNQRIREVQKVGNPFIENTE
jgi:deoxyribonuclease-1